MSCGQKSGKTAETTTAAVSDSVPVSAAEDEWLTPEEPSPDTEVLAEEGEPDSSADSVAEADSTLPLMEPAVDSISRWQLGSIGLYPDYTDTCGTDMIGAESVKKFTIRTLSAGNGSPERSGYRRVSDSLLNLYGTLPTIDSVCILSMRTIYTTFGLRNKYGHQNPLVDSMMINLNLSGYDWILAYRRLLSFGVPLAGGIPSVVRNCGEIDSLALKTLPKAGISEYLADGHFFFMGAGPFLRRPEPRDTTFHNSEGKPEIRLNVEVNANTTRLLNIVRHLPGGVRMNISFGPPLGSYESGSQEVNGVGSLVHELIDRLCVYFITEEGMIAGELVSITQKLAPEELGCVSDLPHIVFACPVIPGEEILGIYMPYEKGMPASCTVSRSKKLWTADLDGDGIPEFAAVISMFEGISSDQMYRILWYANIGGVWKPVDSAEDPDCT
ncbi:MAG: hypothetical protein JW863_07825 [Chitinispirillaceae bacterium]|nr:hypothetical protein [Chitinispirillaceae bacterium]